MGSDLGQGRRGTGLFGLLALGVACALALPEAACASGSGSHWPELRVIMKDEMNPSLTRLSMCLFHPDDLPESETGLVGAERMAQRIEQIAGRVVAKRPPRGDAMQFTSYAHQLRETALSLKEAAHTGNREETVHWFSHLQSVCARCHEEFRFRRE